MINGAACNGTDHSGCGHLAATAKVGLNPQGVAVDDATHTVYVTNNADGNLPGTVSVINSATCNGTHTTGCSGPFPTMATGLSPLLAAIDTRTNTLYVSDFSSSAVSVLNTAQCDAAVTSGCHTTTRLKAVGSQPYDVIINQPTSTVYVTQLRAAGSMSIFTASPPLTGGGQARISGPAHLLNASGLGPGRVPPQPCRCVSDRCHAERGSARRCRFAAPRRSPVAGWIQQHPKCLLLDTRPRRNLEVKCRSYSAQPWIQVARSAAYIRLRPRMQRYPPRATLPLRLGSPGPARGLATSFGLN